MGAAGPQLGAADALAREPAGNTLAPDDRRRQLDAEPLPGLRAHGPRAHRADPDGDRLRLDEQLSQHLVAGAGALAPGSRPAHDLDLDGLEQRPAREHLSPVRCERRIELHHHRDRREQLRGLLRRVRRLRLRHLKPVRNAAQPVG